MIDIEKLKKNVPDQMKQQKCWVGFITRPRGERLDKIPMNAMTGQKAKSNDPATWTDFDTAIEFVVQRGYHGIGFVFQPPFVGFDGDKCIKDGVVAPHVAEIIKTLNTYTELSPSGKGVHSIGTGSIPRGRNLQSLGIEIYTKGRFFTVTGNRLEDYPAEVADCQEALTHVWAKYFEKPKENDILGKIAKSKDAGKFNKLFSGQWQGDYPSQSEADLALCNKLAFWTNKAPGKMDELFRQSSLFRPKWDEKHFGDGKTYGQSVIEKAIEGCQEVYGKKPGSSVKQKLTQGEIITRDCEENIKDFFRDQHGSAVVVLPVEDHDEVCPMASVHFRNWTATRYRRKYGVPPKTDAINQARIQIEARCAVARQTELFNRVGWHEGKIYYDLTTADHRGIAIDEHGWSVVPLAPVFRRYQHQAQQVLPIPGGDPRDLLQFCNVAPDDHCLFLVIVASYFIPNIPHVIISQNGEQGSGKSNNSRKIKGLVDPSRVMLISTPKDLEQAQMTAEKHWVCTFDNISRIHEWYSDFLCRGVTGEGDMKRSLYTNDDEFIRSYRRCFVLNGIGASLWRPDLLDRAVIFDIPILKGTKPEQVMEEEWRKTLPGILGGFFTVISKAMGKVGSVSGHQKFRMSDFAQWGAVLAEAFGYSQEDFFRKYQESVDRKWQETADDSVFARKIKDFIGRHGGYWSGSAADLLRALGPEDDAKGLPKSAKWLSTELVRIAPVMRNVGIDIIKKEKREGGTGRRIFVIQKFENKSCEEGVSSGSGCEATDEVDGERPF